MSKISMVLSVAILCLCGCAEMPAYSNLGSVDVLDESRYTVLETESYIEQAQRSYISFQAKLNIIRVDGKKVGDIPFSTYFYKNNSPQQAMLQPGGHSVQLKYVLPRHFMYADFEFEGKAGQKVMARTKYIGLNRIDIWLEDAATGELVGKRIR
ncbi:hypothetical protein HW090_11540 [Pseudomonas sp. ABC1]|uniref:hypothetical protein n=1 Tax=Pseudomonas sp. ABC1 TaxID=2748080 RepID=UPI0015C32594|nr:hypothetical protein [Pseudomonas sp. ABC1]QLF93794.1 hypothetical protein HW090_11540 [Pseudomonas sp. ABC1]